MYTNGEATGLKKEFIDFVLSDQGQNIAKSAGFIPKEVRFEKRVCGSVNMDFHRTSGLILFWAPDHGNLACPDHLFDPKLPQEFCDCVNLTFISRNFNCH
jgi:hypothetical protein